MKRLKSFSKILILIISILFAAQTLVSCGNSRDAVIFASGAFLNKNVQSSFSYKIYKKPSHYRKAFKDKMSEAYEIMQSFIDDDRTIPIPGIVETYTTGKDSNSISFGYVPQGLCKAGDFFLVTAYDGDKERNSVIYVVDFAEKKIISTLTLPNKYHAGGIAFDGERIWVTGATSDKYEGDPFVQYIDYADFEEMIQHPLCRVTKKKISPKVYIKNKPSFLECTNGVLWVGTYVASKNTQRGYMNGYPISSQNGKVKLDTMMYYVISGIDSSAQGAAIYGNYLYVSSSYMGWTSRIKSSFVTMYDIDKLYKGKTQINLSGREIRRIEVPKMNEEIEIDEGILYINYESAYDGWPVPVIRTDRIMAVRRNLWR